jgi:hypothetical protein
MIAYNIRLHVHEQNPVRLSQSHHKESIRQRIRAMHLVAMSLKAKGLVQVVYSESSSVIVSVSYRINRRKVFYVAPGFLRAVLSIDYAKHSCLLKTSLCNQPQTKSIFLINFTKLCTFLLS